MFIANQNTAADDQGKTNGVASKQTIPQPMASVHAEMNSMSAYAGVRLTFAKGGSRQEGEHAEQPRRWHDQWPASLPKWSA